MRAPAGRPGWDAYNGVYCTGERGRNVRMNSETSGLRIEEGGYDSIVHDAVRLSYDGIYIHFAPWSVADQGVRNVSHGCINISAGGCTLVLRQLTQRRPGHRQNWPGPPVRRLRRPGRLDLLTTLCPLSPEGRVA
ncbi:L,D-transpeptidase [Dietzia alimentaria]|uniref:L,D-transpeptidase n=1 Tax=Dietzia alimentaria TaxID=665550 RepID=UPI0030835246